MEPEQFGKSDSQWINTVLKKGTIADRLAAHTLLVHESKNLASLSAIIDMVDANKCRRECLMAMDTLKELFLDSLSTNSVEQKDLNKIQFYFTKFIDRLEAVAFDNLETTRNKAINTMADLLVRHPENKKYIMEKLVNKIGDRVPKIATHASHLVEKIINEKKPELKEIAVAEAERFLNRPKIDQRAQYYTLCMLNHLILSRKNPDLANKLLEIYLKYFSTQVKQGIVDSKLMGALLIGINRAYPFAKLNMEIFEQQLQVLYTIVHYVNYTMSVQALVLIHTILIRRALTQKIPIEDRFYNTVYNHLLHSEMHSSSRQQSLLNLIYTLVSQDKLIERQKAFIKRLLQVALVSSAPLCCSILLVVIKLMNSKASNKNLLPNPEAGTNEEKSTQESNQVKTNPGDKKKLSKEEENSLKLSKFIDADDDEEERYEDVPEDEPSILETCHKEDDAVIVGKKRKSNHLMDQEKAKRALLMSAKISGKYSDVTNQLLNSRDEESEPVNLDSLVPKNDKLSSTSWKHNSASTSKEELKDYDPIARNPKYAKAGKCKMWELYSLRQHHHPSVVLFANKVISGQYYIYDGDALEDFGVKNFLDKFVSRNPKKDVEAQAKDTQDSTKTKPVGKKAVDTHASKCLFSRTVLKNRPKTNAAPDKALASA